MALTSHWPSPPGDPTPEEQLAAAKAAQGLLDAKRALVLEALASANLASKNKIGMGYCNHVPAGYYKQRVEAIAAEKLREVSPEEAARLSSLAAKREANVASIERERALRAFKAEAARVFALADVDASGELEIGELVAIRQSEEMAKYMLANTDEDSSGTISLAEWTKACLEVWESTPRGAEMMLQLYEAWIREEPSKQRSTRRRRGQ